MPSAQLCDLHDDPAMLHRKIICWCHAAWTSLPASPKAAMDVPGVFLGSEPQPLTFPNTQARYWNGPPSTSSCSRCSGSMLLFLGRYYCLTHWQTLNSRRTRPLLLALFLSNISNCWPMTPTDQQESTKAWFMTEMYTPEIQHRYQQLPCLKGVTFSNPSFWVSMLVFGAVSLHESSLLPVTGMRWQPLTHLFHSALSLAKLLELLLLDWTLVS